MSLDVTLTDDSGVVFEFNITHNLTGMAQKAGIYYAIWRPEERAVETAVDLITVLELGLTMLMSKPEHFKRFTPENEWGSYETLLHYVRRYLAACKDHPDAKVTVCR